MPRRAWQAIVVGVALLAVGLSGLAWALVHSGVRVSQGVPAAARAPGPSGVAGAYGYPARCLSITIPAAAPSYARADFDRRAACGRYTGDPTAVFHRSHGAWRVVLDAIAYTCPVVSIPPDVQTTLGICDLVGRTRAPHSEGRGVPNTGVRPPAETVNPRNGHSTPDHRRERISGRSGFAT